MLVFVFLDGVINILLDKKSQIIKDNFGPLRQSWTIKDDFLMQKLGASFARFFGPGDVLALCGPFGVGKTTLVKGVAIGLGIEEDVDSPSFVSAKVYNGGRLTLYHIDAYRISNDAQEGDLYAEMIEGAGICVIEWAMNLISWLPDHTYFLDMTISSNGERVINLFGRNIFFEEG